MPKLMRPTRSGWRLSQGALVKRSEKQGPDPCSASTHGGGGGQRKRQHCLRTALVTAIFVTAITSGAAACWHPLNTKLGSLHLEPGESLSAFDTNDRLPCVDHFRHHVSDLCGCGGGDRAGIISPQLLRQIEKLGRSALA